MVFKKYRSIIFIVLTMMILSNTFVFGQEVVANTEPIEDNDGITARNGGELIDDFTGGKLLNIKSDWISGGDSPGNGGGLFNDGDKLFRTENFTLYANVSIADTDDKRTSIILIGNSENYIRVIPTGDNDKGILEVKFNNSNIHKYPLKRAFEKDQWTGFGLVYNEGNNDSVVSIFIDGEKVLDSQAIGFNFSELADVNASIGTTYGTGYLRKGKFDNIVVLNRKVTDDEAINETMDRDKIDPPVYDSIRPGQYWLDTEGELIEAHGGSVQKLNEAEINYDINGDGELNKDYWFWYGEEKTSATRPVEGVKAYISEDLTNWTDLGTVLPTHDILPVKLTDSQKELEFDPNSLEKLKKIANLTEPIENVTQKEITQAKEFVEAYVTSWVDEENRVADEYNEENLRLAFENLYGRYNIVERPKMIFNKQTGKFVIVFHADGPQYNNADLVNWVKRGADSSDNNTGSRYGRAMLGFAESDTPFGPFELVNVTRMNWTEGITPSNRYGEARDFTVFVDYGKDINNDNVDDAYAIYSSEMNAEMYVSLLNSDYTGPAVEAGDAEPGVDYNYRAIPDQHREASSVFYYNGYYYMMTSGTDGWNSTNVIYYRSKSMIVPRDEQWERVGDPFAESGTKGYDSQPTYVIVVDQQKGQFIYMGDRWKISSNGSAGPDSRYVWLPIEIGSNNDFTISWQEEWKVEDLKYKGDINIKTELPEKTNIKEIPELPVELEIEIGGQRMNVPVEWHFSDALFNTPGMVQVKGELTSIGREVSHKLAVVPSNVIYFVNPSVESSIDYEQLVSYMSDTLLNKSIYDQPYDSENGHTWGYSGGNTILRQNSDNIFESFRYIDGNRQDFTYTFEVDEGEYTIYTGFYDPWAQWSNGNRKADIIINGDIVDFEYQIPDYYDTREYTGVEPSGGKINLKLQTSESVAGKDNSDPQLSWIMVVSNSFVDKTELTTLYETHKNKVEAEYTKSSWLVFESALNEAERVLADDGATQADIDKRVEELKMSISQLEKHVHVDKIELTTLYETHKDKVEAEYTKASWLVFESALNETERVLADDGATQEEVDQAIGLLLESLDSLVNASVNDLTNKLPNTSTNLYSFLLIGLLLLLLGAILIKMYSKNENTKY